MHQSSEISLDSPPARLQVAIVDDERGGQVRLLDLLAEQGDCEVVGVCGDLETARQLVAARPVDLLFVDIQLPDGSGFELLDEADPARSAVVFVTAHERHAIRAFDAGAVDYLLKPFDAARLSRAVKRAHQHLARCDESSAAVQAPPGQTPVPARLALRLRGRVLLLPIRDIDWFEARRNSIRVHLKERTLVTRDTLRRLAQALEPQRFVRIHRSTLVNLDRVLEILVAANGDYSVVLQDGSRHGVGRNYRQVIRDVMADLQEKRR